ncbi:hypothetical protein HZS61_008560 [Fusarium oxysporum f. sp. conglutinans]|uniref:Uncharacterized protein n=1 Tax=Fusarium oxysporum f. sp. conglutinans TaxID=100902 RepID=A0A8H6LQB4_FUSOX|nr:hypothetical protein HZS61_008560 [Fusarium oxysporum f. sp. conglutinans]
MRTPKRMTTEDDTATVTVREQMKKQPETRPIMREQQVAELMAIYVGLVMVENKCIEVADYQMGRASGQLDITRYLSMFPKSKLIQLQNGETRPEDTVRSWHSKVHKDVTKDSPPTSEDSSTTPPTTTDTLHAIFQDCPTTSKEASAYPQASEKTAPQVGSDDDYLHGFQVALENRAKELGWHEYQDIAELTTAEIGEEGRQKVINEKRFLAIGYELVDQFLQDFESIKEKAEKKIADEAKAEQEAAQAKKRQQGLEPRPRGDADQCGDVSREGGNGSPGGAFEEIDPQEVEDASKKVAPEEVTAMQQHSALDTNLSTQGPQASPEDASVPPKNSGKDAADTTVDTSVIIKETKSKSERKPKTKLQFYVDFRPLSGKHWYKRVGKEIWVLADGQWVSLTAEDFAALTALHPTLLQEHHDFFLASQHPSASAATMATQANDKVTWQRWRDISREEYTRDLGENLTTSRLYHHLAILEEPWTRVSPDESFDAVVSQLLYYTKSLVLKTAFSNTRGSMLILIQRIVARNEEEAE